METLPENSIEDQALRERAVKLAINNIEAFKNSVIKDGFTTSLLKSADAIFNFIKHGKLPN
jgi:hypothetical protein